MQRNIIQCGWIFLLGMMLSTPVMAQLELGVNVSPGSSNIILDQNAIDTRSGGLGLQLGLLLQYKLNDNLIIGTGFGIANNAASFGLDNYELEIAGEPTIFDANTPATYDRRIRATGVSEEVAINFMQIPLYAQYLLGSSESNIRPYLGAGLDIGLTMSGSSYTGRGTGSYRGFFITEVEKAPVELYDIPTYGFEEGVAFNEEQNFDALNGTNIGVLLVAGTYVNINDNLKFKAGIKFGQGLTNLSGYNPNEYVLSYQPGDYNTLIGGSSNAATRFIGLELGIVYSLGGGQPSYCPPNKFDVVPIQYVQQTNNRRDPKRMDPEFTRIAPEINPMLLFSPRSFQIRREGPGIAYCTMGEASPERITVEVKGRHPYLSLDRFDSRFDPLSDSFMVSMAIAHDAELRLVLQDEDTEEPIDEFQVKLLVGRDVIVDKTMNSGDVIYDLYNHPNINYTLKIQRECYPDQSIELNRATDLNTNKVISIAATGTAERLDLPLQSSVIKGRERLQARMSTGTLSGNIGARQISLFAPCGQKIGQNLSLELEKPLGYDIISGTNTPDWGSKTVSVAIVDGKPAVPLKVEKVPAYHFFYVDISEAEDRAIILDTLEARMIRVADENDEYLAYLSNGTDPTVAEVGDEYEDVLVDITRTFTDPPVISLDRDQILKEMKLEKVRPDRRKTIFNFFLSRTIYQQSREQLITYLTETFGEDQRNVQINIYTDYAVSESDKLAKGMYQTPVRYIQLK